MKKKEDGERGKEKDGKKTQTQCSFKIRRASGFPALEKNTEGVGGRLCMLSVLSLLTNNNYNIIIIIIIIMEKARTRSFKPL